MLKLENFQGIRSLELIFGGKDATVYGANGSGKSTVCNAVTWLLFDKPSTDVRGWSPKTFGQNGEKHNLDHSAEAVFVLDDCRLRLKKTFHEVWKKKRGAQNPEFSGNVTSYAVNGVPSLEKEYRRAVESICGGAETLRLLTTPDYFSTALNWQDRRKILLDVCGDVSDADVIAGHTELAELPAILLMPGATADLGQRYSVDEYIKIAKGRKADLNKRLEAIPGRIDEATRAIPDVCADESDLDAHIADANDKLEALKREKTDTQIGDTSTLTTALSTAKRRYAEAEAKYLADQNQSADGIFCKMREEKEAETMCYKEVDAARREIDRLTENIERMKAKRENARAEYNKVLSEVWTKDMEACPTCGQALPADKLTEMLEAFNLRKSRRLAEINDRGKKVGKDKIAALEKDLSYALIDFANATRLANEHKEKYDVLSKQYIDQTPYSQTEDGMSAAENIRQMEEKIRDVMDNAKIASIVFDDKIRECTADLDDLMRQKAAIGAAKRQRQRVTELEQEERRLAQEYEAAEKGLYLCEKFTAAKVAALTDRINDRFHGVSFRLFREQVNGGLTDCCDVLVPSPWAMVPYSSANTSGRINAGIEVIRVLSKHYGIQAPLLVDGAESVTSLTPIDTQVIRFTVSPEDKTLRIVRTI